MEGSPLKMGFVLKGKAALVVVVMLVLLGLVARTEAQTNCTTVSAGITACADLLGVDVQIGIPSSNCCAGLQSIAQVSATIGANLTCQCMRNTPPLLGLPDSILNLNGQVLASASLLCRGVLAINATINPPLGCLF